MKATHMLKLNLRKGPGHKRRSDKLQIPVTILKVETYGYGKFYWVAPVGGSGKTRVTASQIVEVNHDG